MSKNNCVYFVDSLPMQAGTFTVEPVNLKGLWEKMLIRDDGVEWISLLNRWWVETVLHKNLPLPLETSYNKHTIRQSLRSLDDGQEFVVVAEGEDDDHMALYWAVYHVPEVEDAEDFEGTPDPEGRMVDVIASGYEWDCPECGQSNNEIETKERVSCSGCGLSFEAYPAIHAEG